MKKERSSTATAVIVLVAVATFLAFLVLQLCGVLDWSWWWVTAPLWGSFGLFLLALGFLGMCLLILSYAAKHRRNR